MSTTDSKYPTPPSWRAKPLAHILSYIVTLKFISNSGSWLRSIGCDWFALMESENLNYRLRQWLIGLGYDTGQIRAERHLVARDTRVDAARAERAREAAHTHIVYGSACPGCGRASLGHGGYCMGGIIRRHAPMRRRGAAITYYE
jgi:hypothetical protein